MWLTGGVDDGRHFFWKPYSELCFGNICVRLVLFDLGFLLYAEIFG